ncbi:hypothetical protein LPW11_19540 [Geomonas sp. RF6]|uniref:hypothetical protein n=1 Tax=Geomonas sp. RF6 TaxID=2897342 RepID=UPI001E3FF9BD|nr:hypothetical protein [Geomonas sp. RF6]UFS70061.1 hypothetical protein LPW11_19540 [Geomonas sp. RF6]
MKLRTIFTAFVITASLTSSFAYAETTPADAPATETIATLTKENQELQEKLKVLQQCSITSSALAVKTCARLKEIAADVRQQRQGMADFEGYVKWMSNNIAGYNKYLAAGSAAAGFAKVLPIPYAGQASGFAKFVSNAAISLSNASVSINNYLGTSQRFISGVDALDPAKGVSPAKVSELVRLADGELLKSMLEVQQRLAATSELSSSSLAFLESINHYIGSTDEYWAKTKSLVKSGETDKKEKGFLADSITALRNRAQGFNGRFKVFADTVQKDTPLVKSLMAYEELMRDLEPKVAKAK